MFFVLFRGCAERGDLLVEFDRGNANVLGVRFVYCVTMRGFANVSFIARSSVGRVCCAVGILGVSQFGDLSANTGFRERFWGWSRSGRRLRFNARQQNKWPKRFMPLGVHEPRTGSLLKIKRFASGGGVFINRIGRLEIGVGTFWRFQFVRIGFMVAIRSRLGIRRAGLFGFAGTSLRMT